VRAGGAGRSWARRSGTGEFLLRFLLAIFFPVFCVCLFVDLISAFFGERGVERGRAVVKKGS
jgi:hypothetical protein